VVRDWAQSEEHSCPEAVGTSCPSSSSAWSNCSRKVHSIARRKCGVPADCCSWSEPGESSPNGRRQLLSELSHCGGAGSFGFDAYSRQPAGEGCGVDRLVVEQPWEEPLMVSGSSRYDTPGTNTMDADPAAPPRTPTKSHLQTQFSCIKCRISGNRQAPTRGWIRASGYSSSKATAHPASDAIAQLRRIVSPRAYTD
jgi:hypothetical protein